MAISSLFSSQLSPIAIDFGSSIIRLLQLEAGQKPNVIAASQLELPSEVRKDQNKRFEYLAVQLPKHLRKGKFKGKRVTCSIPSSRTFVQHFQVPLTGSITGEDFINGQLHALTGFAPSNLVIRTTKVMEISKENGNHSETICFAIPRDVVMNQIELLKKCKLEVVGVHTEQHAMVWAFQHLHRRDVDGKFTNLLVDMGWGSTKVGISHGNKLVFSKSIPIGGRHFDQLVADAMKCDIDSANAHRVAAMEPYIPVEGVISASNNTSQKQVVVAVGGEESGTATTVKASERRGDQKPPTLHEVTGSIVDNASLSSSIDFSELKQSINDELSMCIRYYNALFENRSISRVIFLGGESRNVNLCRLIAKNLNVSAQLGDPMVRFEVDDRTLARSIKNGEPKPGWAVVCGLCSCTE